MENQSSTVMLTDQQAYAAMFHFLEELYFSTKSDELGALLGSMALLADGDSADSAMLDQWRRAVEYAQKGGAAGRLELRGGGKASG